MSPAGPEHAAFAALEALPAAVVLVGSDGGAVWANAACRGLADGGGRGTADATRLLDAIASSGPVKSVLATASPSTGVVRLPTDRGVVEREVSAALVDGTEYVVASFPVETDQRVAETAADELLVRLEAMLEHTADIITVLDRDGSIRFSNAAAGRLTGLSGAEINGRSALDLVHPDDVDLAARRFAEAIEHPGLSPTTELRLRFGDDRWHDVDVSVNNLIGVPPIDGLVVTIRDVTERRANEAWLRSLIENLTDVIVLLDERFDITFVSEGISRMIDAPADTNIGMSAFNDVHPDDLPHVVDALSQVAAGPLGATVRVDLRLESRPGSGAWRWIEATAVNRLADPAVGRIVCTLRDVTEHKEAAYALQAAYEGERANAERLRDLDRLKDDFLATVSHELRTPLAAIVGFADLLQRGGLDAELAEDLLSRIAWSAGEMRSMIDNVLDFSALEAGKAALRLEAVDVRAALTQAVAEVALQLSTHRLDVHVADGLVVVADRHGFGHVIRNLLTNAAKYSEPGSTIDVRADRDATAASRVAIAVRDEGMGIAPELHERIFERFYRAPDASFAARGSGIGLSIVRRYVELMAGEVSLASAPGRGSTFTIVVPAAT